MIIIKNSRLLGWCKDYPNAEQQLLAWAAYIKGINIKNLNELRMHFNKPKVLLENRVIFRIKGNEYRLVAIVMVGPQRVYLRWFGTHAEYDKIDPGEV